MAYTPKKGNRYGSNNDPKPQYTVQQARNMGERRAMDAHYADVASRGGYGAIAKANVPYKPVPGRTIPGVPGMLEREAQKRVEEAHYERMTAKKPGLLSRIHRAVNIRQHLGRKK